jgi:hypothetical protein
VVAARCACSSQRDDFCMCTGVVIRNGSIVADTRGFPVDDHDGANRNLIEFQRDAGLCQRRTHVRYVRFDPIHYCRSIT